MHLKTVFLIGINLLFILTLSAQKSDDFFKKLPQEGGMLYFFQQQEWKAENGKACLVPDFSYRYYEKNSGTDSVLVHATLIDRHRIDQVDQVSFQSGSDTFSGKELDLLFVEKKGKKWHHRYGVKITAEEFLSLLQNPGIVKCKFDTPGPDYVFSPKKKWQKQAEIVYGILVLETGVGKPGR